MKLKLLQVSNVKKHPAGYHRLNYTAWVCPDIKAATGPWKLSGLPGLILEADDSKQEVFFSCTSLSLSYPTTLPLPIPTPVISASAKEYAHLKTAFLEDPVSFFESAPGLVSGTITGGSKNITSANSFRPKNKSNQTTILSSYKCESRVERRVI